MVRTSTFSRLGEDIPLRRIGIMAIGAAIATIGLVTYGSWVRVSGSGLGCPDWPLCNGGLTPGGDRATAIEYGHRLFAGLTMLGVFGAAFLSFQRRRDIPLPSALLVAASALILTQAALGGAAVLAELPGSIVLAHFGMAMTILALVTTAGVLILTQDRPIAQFHLRAQPLVLIGAFVIMMGGSIVATESSFKCLDLPFCDGGGVMSQWLHGFHRIAGLFLGGGVGFLLWHLWRRSCPQPLFLIALALAGLLTAQMILGVVAIVLSFPSELRIVHVALATLVWWALVAIWALSSPKLGVRPEAGPGFR